MTTTTKVSIFGYSDYRTCMKDNFEKRRVRNPSFSYRSWARLLGLSSPSTLVMILKGTRNPSPDLTERLADTLGIDGNEREYFKQLVALAKAKTNPTKAVLLLERLKDMSPNKEFALLDDDSFAAISNWHYYAIREMVTLPDFCEDGNWIARRLRFRMMPKECVAALETLQKLHLLKRNANGKLVLSQGDPNTPSDIASEGLRRYHEQVLTNARASLRATKPEDREIVGSTFGIRKSDLPKIKALIRQFQMEVCNTYEKPQNDEIYQLEIGFFPLTK